MAPVPVRLLAAITALLSTASVNAETLSLALRPGQPVEAVLVSPLDDSNYQDPRGYQQHGSSPRAFVRKLTLTNTGTVPLTGPLLIVNDRDWSSPEALRKSLALSDEPRALMPRLFTFWQDHVTHADSDAPGGKEPLALLNFWSYALCGDTTAALTRLATAYGIPARKIPLNGHVAAEYFYDNAWHVLDADQKACYLRLDNHTLASAADLRADPFLTRRTKVFGRYAAMDAGASAFNTSLHEYLEPTTEKPVSHKSPPAPVRNDTLFPGEKVILHYDQAPDPAVGRTNLRRWGTVREDALRVVEFVIIPKARSSAASGEIVFASGYPILRAVNHATGEVFTGPAGQPIFELPLKFRAPDDRISAFCQRAHAALPRLQKGRNMLLLAADDPKGAAQLTAEWEPATPDALVPVVTAALADGTPTFRVSSTPAADLVWWQVSTDKVFAFVAPNFDTVAPAVETVTFDPLTATFYNPGQPYFFRIKARHAGVWGEWSAPLEFRVDKPARPAPANATLAGDRLRLTWPDAGADCEYLVFGSHRLDFLPEPFASEEIIAMHNQGIEQSRPNKNLVAVVKKPEIEFEPAFRFYRVITSRAGVLSVPGDLIVTPPALAAKLPPPIVLQDRWRRVGESDEHVATEMPLP